MGAHADGVDDDRHEARDRVGIGERGALATVQVERGKYAPGRAAPRGGRARRQDRRHAASFAT